MILVCFIFTDFHNILIILSSIFGLIALIGIITTIIKNEWNTLFSMGVICGVILVVLNFIYYTGIGSLALPLFQKFSLMCILLYVVILNRHVDRITCIDTNEI